MNSIVIGDPHLKMSNIDEAQRFIDQTLSMITNGSYDSVIVLGDLFDNFAIVRSEILALWTDFFLVASRHCRVIALVGNHDMSGADGGTNPMVAFASYKNVSIIDQTTMIDINNQRFFFMPFVRDNAEFEAACRKIPAGSTLFCHQSFNGAQFENGFYDPHGADPACVAHLAGVISGHIHREQKVENIWYPGTPFQHTFGDAGQEKGIWELSLGSHGYNIVMRIRLDMPEYIVIEADDIPSLTAQMEGMEPSSQWKVKVVARGTPTEIQAFWLQPVVKNWKAVCKRVSDGLTSTKMSQNSVGTKAKSQRERLNEFITQRTWRTTSDRVITRAQEFFRC